MSSKYGQYAFKSWYYSGLLNFETQMADGFKYPNDSVRISTLMAPGYFTISMGMDYKPKDYVSMLLSPLTGKTTFVYAQELADAGAFGVEKAVTDGLGNIITPGKNVRYEFGGYMKIIFNKELIKNINFQTKLDLFSNYLNNPQNVDVNWEVLIAMKFNKYISANINTLLIYDDDIKIKDENAKTAPGTQFKELFGIGFSYKF